MGKSNRMNQFDKIPKSMGDKNSDIIADSISSIDYKQMIFLFYKYFKPYQTLNLVENNRKSYDIEVFIRLVTKNNRKEGRKEEKERQTYRFFSG